MSHRPISLVCGHHPHPSGRCVKGCPAVERERRLGHRIIRSGEHITIKGVRGIWRVLGFRGQDVEVFGAKTAGRAPMVRTFTADRVGVRKKVAQRS